jgi:hypothetical protein
VTLIDRLREAAQHARVRVYSTSLPELLDEAATTLGGYEELTVQGLQDEIAAEWRAGARAFARLAGTAVAALLAFGAVAGLDLMVNVVFESATRPAWMDYALNVAAGSTAYLCAFAAGKRVWRALS